MGIVYGDTEIHTARMFTIPLEYITLILTSNPCIRRKLYFSVGECIARIYSPPNQISELRTATHLICK